MNVLPTKRLQSGENEERFLMFGVIYLTKDATAEYFDTPIELRRSKYIQALLDNDRNFRLALR